MHVCEVCVDTATICMYSNLHRYMRTCMHVQAYTYSCECTVCMYVPYVRMYKLTCMHLFEYGSIVDCCNVRLLVYVQISYFW